LEAHLGPDADGRPGVNTRRLALDRRLALNRHPLGALLSLGCIANHHHEAGQRYSELHRFVWGRSHATSPLGRLLGAPAGAEDERVDRHRAGARRHLDEAIAEVRRIDPTGRTLRLLDDVAVSERATSWSGKPCDLAALRAALDALVRLWRIPRARTMR
jgi:hypothetical protein